MVGDGEIDMTKHSHEQIVMVFSSTLQSLQFPFISTLWSCIMRTDFETRK